IKSQHSSDKSVEIHIIYPPTSSERSTEILHLIKGVHFNTPSKIKSTSSPSLLHQDQRHQELFNTFTHTQIQVINHTPSVKWMIDWQTYDMIQGHRNWKTVTEYLLTLAKQSNIGK
ncbi:hypothetical protein PV325_000640, partial [Microctonus aethiopoides]